MRNTESKHRCLVLSGTDEVLFCVCIMILGIHLQRIDNYKSTERFVRPLNLKYYQEGN